MISARTVLSFKGPLLTTGMTEQRCLEYVGLPVCGYRGHCVVNESSAACVCDAGWSQTWEMSPFFDARTKISLEQLPCLKHDQLLQSIYACVCVCSLVSLVLCMQLIFLYANNLETRKLLRFLPLFVCETSALGCSVLKLAEPDKRGILNDVGFTTLILMTWASAFLAQLLSYSHYLNYATNPHRLPFSADVKSRTYRVLIKLQVPAILIGMMLAFALVVSYAVSAKGYSRYLL